MADASLFRYYVATAVSVWFVSAITVATELVPALKAFIAGVFLHHWLGKGILMLVVFGLVVAVTPERRFDERRWANYVLGSVLAGGLLVVGFYVVHYVAA